MADPFPFTRMALLGAAIPLFLVPGWMLGRIFPSRLPAISSFLGSAAILFNLILGLDALGIAVNLRTVACGFAAVGGAIALWAHRRHALEPRPLAGMDPPRDIEWLWLIPAVLALTSVTARTLLEPLSGFDNIFRWNYLAKLMVSHHSISSYPPVRAEDFNLYSWCDGIPPLVPFLNFLIYSVAGSVAPELISIRAVAEFLLLALLVRRLAADLWGRSAGWAGLAVLGSCTLLIWGLSIEQETGLTAISLTAMVFFIQASDETADSSAVWAGVAAAVGAISREYGIYFILLGAGILWVQDRKRIIPRFLIPAVLLAAPWYVRNWIKTGNPVYPAMGSLFPTNSVHQEIMGDIANFWGFTTSPFRLRMIPVFLLATAGAAGLLGLLGMIRLRSRSRVIAASIALVTGLWVWSMPYTAGGWNYSMRVLVPALALASVLGAWIGTVSRRWQALAAGLLALVSVDSARRAWLLPDDPLTTPWTLSFAEWRHFQVQSHRFSGSNLWPVLVQAANGKGIVVETTAPHVEVAEAGGLPVPFESPQFAPAVDPRLSVEEALQRLRQANIRFITFSANNLVINRFIERHPTLAALRRDYEPVVYARGVLIFDLDYLQRRKSPEAPGRQNGNR